MCPFCNGSGKMDFSKDNEQCIPSCASCSGEGTMFGYYKTKIKLEKSMSGQYYRQLKELRDNIKKISKCTTCHGDQSKTMGLLPCPECGLIGTMPWGG